MAVTSARPTFSPALSYRDNRAALAWLEQAFGFEPSMVILDDHETILHAEMRFGDGMIMVGEEWSANRKSPASLGGACTQTVHVHLHEDIDAHCDRARAAGAVIEQEPQTQFYGDRTYRAVDPEGHVWTFGQTVTPMTPQEWDAAAGVTTRERP